MSNQINVDINKKINLLISYFNEWRSENGAYHSPVVHRGNLKRVSDIHDTPWSQSEIISGYCNLLSSRFDNIIHKRLLKAVNRQIQNLDTNGSYKFAGNEDDRYSSLIHNSLATSSLLLSLQYIRSNVDHDHVIQAIKKNIDYIINILWDESHQAFNFDIYDYYTDMKAHHVLNMNALFLDCLVGYYSICNNKFELEKYIKAIYLFIKNNISIEGDSVYVPYSDQKVDEISIYTALTLRGLIGFAKNKRLISKLGVNISELDKILSLIYVRILSFWREEASGFSHGYKIDKEVENPIFVAGSGFCLTSLVKYEKHKGIFPSSKLCNIVSTIAISITPSQPALPNYRGYNTIDNYRNKDGSLVWEDVICLPNWNGSLFHALSFFVSNYEYKEEKLRKFSIKLSPRYMVLETKAHLFVFGTFPLKSFAVYFFAKKKRKPFLWFDLRLVYSLFKDKYVN